MSEPSSERDGMTVTAAQAAATVAVASLTEGAAVRVVWHGPSGPWAGGQPRAGLRLTEATIEALMDINSGLKFRCPAKSRG